MSKRALPSFSVLQANYPTDPDSDNVIRQLGGELTQSWVGPNSCVMRMSKAFNYAGKTHQIPESREGLLTVKGGDGRNYAIRVIEFIHYLHTQYCIPDLVKTGSAMKPESFSGKKGIIAWLIDGWSDARGHFTLWDGSQGLFEGEHHYFADFGPSAPQNGPHMVKVEFWTC
jgi:Type VI secretion system (T6SS), amidase effector protein 4